ncbi:hypothetical protein N2152v2_009653 [Parachlorella kessleri]
MSCQTKARQPAGAPRLPREVVQHIFSVKTPIHPEEEDEEEDDAVPLLSLKDRMLTGLFLAGENAVHQSFLASVRTFPCLTSLFLQCTDAGQLDLRRLRPLTALKRLGCGSWERIELKGGTLLPRLSLLRCCGGTGDIDIDVALPSLRTLLVEDGANSIRLAGDELQLAQLSQLTLDVRSAVVRWPALHNLAVLSLLNCHQMAGNGLSALGCLTSLTLEYECDWSPLSFQVPDMALQALAPSLRQLDVDFVRHDWSQMPPLRPMRQLTSLTCYNPSIVWCLGPLEQLQHLQFPSLTATGLTVEHLDWLNGLASLRRLWLGTSKGDVAAVERRVQVRALAVCRAWKEYLDPRLFPFEMLWLSDSDAASTRIAEWVTVTRPATRFLDSLSMPTAPLLLALASLEPRTILTRLSLSGEHETHQSFLLAIPAFPCLKSLCLDCTSEGQLDLRRLQPLSALERLYCTSWDRVELQGGTLLPHLSFLHFWTGRGEIDIDAALPSLQSLVVQDSDVGLSLRLAGDALHLAQLSRLSFDGQSATIRWLALPSLAMLRLSDCHQMAGDGLSALVCLTSLTLVYDCVGAQPSFQVPDRVLQALAPSLRQLDLDYRPRDDWSQVPPLPPLRQLTRLTCRSPGIIWHLSGLEQLQDLEFHSLTATSLTLEHLDWLHGLTSLRRLSLNTIRGGNVTAVDRRVQVLRKVVPAGCAVKQAVWLGPKNVHVC